jgi:hypothetical protein
MDEIRKTRGLLDSSLPGGNPLIESGYRTIGLSVASLTLQNPFPSKVPTILDQPQIFWKQYLSSLLPTQTQCDLLVTYYFENINWIYQAIHAPTFRAEYAAFWSKDIGDVDLIWLSLLYIILCLSAMNISAEMADAADFDVPELDALCRRWYAASRQALTAGGYDSKPTLVQLQVYLVTQLYWYGMKNVEALNSYALPAPESDLAADLDLGI